jgi:putative membrane protein
MFDAECIGFSLWWIFPLIMIALCFFMMRGRMGSMMCGHGPHDMSSHDEIGAETAKDILDRRYALGEINREEYEEKKKAITPDKVNEGKN